MSATNVQITLLICNTDISYYLITKDFQTFRNLLQVDPDFKNGVGKRVQINHSTLKECICARLVLS